MLLGIIVELTFCVGMSKKLLETCAVRRRLLNISDVDKRLLETCGVMKSFLEV